MRVSVVVGEELIYNGLPITDEEALEYSKAAETAGVPISVDPLDLSFQSVGNTVLGGPTSFSASELEALALRALLEVKPYPEWLLNLKGDGEISGLHTVILVHGLGRFELREELVKYAKLVQNTGEEDLYTTKGRFPDLGIEADGVFISTGEDAIENLRRVYAMKLHTDGKGVKRYENLYEENFYNFDRSRGILNLAERIDLNFAIEALRIFEEELVDVRIPQELFWLMKIMGGSR